MSSEDKNIKPPHWANRFLQWFVSDRLIDEIQGDLEEAHYYRHKEKGSKYADRRFIWDVFTFFKPSSFEQYRQTQNQVDMHKNYFKIAYRNFLKYKTYSAINLLGLVLGVLSCLLIYLHVFEELNYDKFHPDYENTYRVTMDMYNNGELSAKSAPIYAAVGPSMVIDFPEIEEQIRILPFGNGVYSVKRPDGSLVRYNEEHGVFAEENFFSMTGFELIEGNAREVLKGKNKVVLSQSTAAKYFGTEDPIGKSISYRGRREMIVTGVMKDFPEHSHMQFELISSLETWDGFEEWPQNWGWYDFYTYIKVSENANISLLSKKLSTYLKEKNPEAYNNTGAEDILELQNIGDVHLYAKGYSWEMGNNGGANQVYFLSAIAIIILIIAWVNFVNLSTARAVKRAKEVGIRKVVGAQKWSLINQFLTEAFAYNAFAVIIGILLTILLVTPINRVIDITLDRTILTESTTIIGIVSMTLFGSIVSGLYPAFVLTSFKPLNVIKGNFYNRKSKFGFRQVLVVFQFAISIILILGTILVVKQLNYMRSQDLGLNVEQTLVIKAPSSSRGDGDLVKRNELFTNRLKALPETQGITTSNVVPGLENFSISSFTTRANPELQLSIYRVRTDENYFKEFDIKLLAGRSYQKVLASDSNAVVINEKALNILGFDNPEMAVGEILNPRSDYSWKIVGVAENYHHSSLKEGLDPIIFFNRPNSSNFFSVKLTTTDYRELIGGIEDMWDEIYPDNPFDFFFLDEFFNRQYKSDQQFNAVFQGFAFLAIVVACLGLFGLVSFTTEQSRKEIGIRKVLGASVMKIVMLFAKDYALLIFFALIIAFPLSYYLMNEWLQEFAYRTSISWTIYVAGTLTILVIAFTTVSLKSYWAAKSNPVGALREE